MTVAPTSTSAPRPSGRTAPTDPPTEVNPVVQSALAAVVPAPGYALVRLILAEEREAKLGFPAGTEAMLDAAMLRLERLASADDLFARDFPQGSIVFASLDGLAPLLGTYLFLLPLERVQGVLPGDADADSSATRA